ncbi:MAG TPA: N-acetyl-gamma-glutamyl-phosphate reductase [Streptosporangiaceae bacterium]
MGARVAVAGASGYAGGELLRLLAAHPDLEIGALAAGSNAGAPVTAVHPNLITLADRAFGPTNPEAFAGCDLVFMALPHGQAAALATELPPQTKVVDLGAGFRLADPASWERFYGGAHPGTWTYGLPELPGARARIRAASRVASPGCFATASILALAPLLAHGVAEPGDIVIVAASGTSGAGRSATVNLLGSEVMGSVSAYKAGGVHRHTPEIEEALQSVLTGTGTGTWTGAPVTISFTPTLAPMPRGILATATARLAAGVSTERLREITADSYGREPFVHLLPEGQWPGTGATSGSNAAQLQVAADLHAGRAIVVSALDNLGKGAAGQAVQNANLMLGLPETAGLTAQGVAP